jgi:hypothetical protein
MFGRKNKKVKIPDGEKEIIGLETWMVYWQSVKCSYESSLFGDLQIRAQAFTSREDALLFKKALEEANILIGNSFAKQITICKV